MPERDQSFISPYLIGDNVANIMPIHPIEIGFSVIGRRLGILTAPDLILFHLNLSRGNGREVLGEIKPTRK